MSDTPNIDELKTATRRLLYLLEDAKEGAGCTTWHQAVSQAIDKMHNITKEYQPLPKADQSCNVEVVYDPSLIGRCTQINLEEKKAVVVLIPNAVLFGIKTEEVHFYTKSEIKHPISFHSTDIRVKYLQEGDSHE